jgi:hypothetical protein
MPTVASTFYVLCVFAVADAAFAAFAIQVRASAALT